MCKPYAETYILSTTHLIGGGARGMKDSQHDQQKEPGLDSFAPYLMNRIMRRYNNGLSDAMSDLNGDGYSNIEEFINGLDPSAPARVIETPKTYRDLWTSDPDLMERPER